MLAGTTSAVDRFVNAVESVISRLEFEAEVDEGDRQRPARSLYGLRCLLLDLKGAAAGDGAKGAGVYLMAAQAHDALTTAVEAHGRGDLNLWRSCRANVLAILANLRRLAEPQHEGELVVRSAAPAAPALPQAPAGTMPAVQVDVDPGRQGENAEKGTEFAERLSSNCRRILRLLKDENATRPVRSWTFEGLREETQLSDGQIRRAMDTLRKHGLYASHRGQDGGVWLTPSGLEIAERISR